MSQTIAADPTAGALDLEDLKGFVFERVLMESTLSGSTYLLGKIHDEPAILLIQRTQIAGDAAPGIVQGGLASLNVFLENKPYFSAHANLLPSAMSDLKITAIWPAGPEHIKKYAAQEHVMFNETAEVYDTVVLPYIESIPAGRISWVYNILAGEKEAERVLFRDEHAEQGFVLLPDLKWDQTSMNAMYLTAITQTRSLRSMRDLTRAHLPLLRNIKAKVEETVLSKYGVDKGKLRMFVHYQPTYYHFHVHIVHIAHEGFAGMWVGKAHLLDDLISLLELSPEDPAESILRRMTLSYALGTNHPLCSLLQAHLSPLSASTTAQSVEASAAAIGQ